MMATNRLPFQRHGRVGAAIYLVALSGLLSFTIAGSNALALDYANSITGWVPGQQGANNWFYGYRDLTADGGGAYDYTAHFLPFINDGSNGATPMTPLGPSGDGITGVNHWSGSQWDLSANPPQPWTELAQETTHPNGTNSIRLNADGPGGTVYGGREHWTIRRWVSDLAAPTQANLKWQIRKTNANCGNGVTGLLFVNGTLVDSTVIAFNATNYATAGQTRDYVTTINPGDIIDLALSPRGTDGSDNDGCDGSAFNLRVTDQLPPPPPVPPLADSFDDWSLSGTQGENSWFNGYYNLTQDPDHTYAVGDFQTMPWNGSGYALPGPPPWTSLGRSDTHPNGTNSAPNEEHWTVRRWVADVSSPTPLAIHWQQRKTNLNGTGTEGRLFINGTQVDAAAIAGNDGVGVNRVYYANIYPGDVVDLALGPTGPTGDRGDGADGSANRLTMRTQIPPNAYNRGAKVADSVAQWSTTGTQGENNWFNGYYDRRADVETSDGVYGVGDLTPFLNDGSNVVSQDPNIGGWKLSPNHWNGSAFDLLNQGAPGAGHGPWTEMGQLGSHPAANAQGDPEVHWLVRRWIAPAGTSGSYELMGTFATAAPCGDGTTGRIFVNGTEVFAGVTQGSTTVGTVIVGLSEGDIVDFVVDPNGSFAATNINAVNDGCDSTNFSGMVTQVHPFVPIPEPSSYVLAALGAIGFGWAARRRMR